MNEIKFKAIGVLHTQGSDAEVREKGDVEGELEIYPGSRKVSMVSMFKQMSPHRFRTIENFPWPFPYS